MEDAIGSMPRYHGRGTMDRVGWNSRAELWHLDICLSPDDPEAPTARVRGMSILRSFLTVLICCLAVPAAAESIEVYRQPRRQRRAIQRALGRSCGPWRRCAHRGHPSVGMHRPACPHPAQQDLRDACRSFRLPLGAAAGRHGDALECLPGRYSRLDQRPRGPAEGFCLDGRPRHLSILP